MYKRGSVYLCRDGSMLAMVDLKPANKIKIKDSLVALLVLTIEFRGRKEERLHLCHGMAVSQGLLSHPGSHR